MPIFISQKLSKFLRKNKKKRAFKISAQKKGVKYGMFLGINNVKVVSF